MTATSVFYITCAIAAVGWIIILCASPFWTGFDKFMVGIVVAILSISYACLNFSHYQPGLLNDFTTLEGIGRLFQDDYLRTAAWDHFLAFDLLAAVWIKRNSVMLNIGHALIIPSLIFTCLLGPLGFLIYLLTRWIKTKNYFARNF